MRFTVHVLLSSAFVLLLSAIGAWSCGGGAQVAGQPVAMATLSLETTIPGQELVEQPAIWNSAVQSEQHCARQLAVAAEHKAELLRQGSGGEAQAHPLVVYNQLQIALDEVLHISDLYANVHPNAEVRGAAEQCQQQVSDFISTLQLDAGVYAALTKVNPESLGSSDRRFIDHLVRDYRRAGVNKDEATRGELAKMKQEMVKAAQAYRRSVREDSRQIEVTVQQLAGLPTDYIDGLEKTADGKLIVTTRYPDLNPVMNYAKNEEVRRDLWKAKVNRAYPANEENLRKLLSLRAHYAATLGYDTWADYEVEDKMMREGSAIGPFLDRIAEYARPRMELERSEMLERKKKDVPDTDGIKFWDNYYVLALQQEKYGVDSQEVRKYFDYPRVKEGVLSVFEKLFAIEFRRVDDAEVWHESVEAYDVYDNGAKLGSFFLDMHPRADKFGHAAMFQMNHGLDGLRLPSASLVCNFPEPQKGRAALMEHVQVKYFFHEFGHLVHHLLAGRGKWMQFSGISTEWDFVEAPSQIAEEWAWNPQVLAAFAKHNETGESIPAELVVKMKNADEFGQGMYVTRQLYLAGMSYTYHAADPSRFGDMNAISREMCERYAPYPFEEDTHYFANFGHLEGYGVMYYTYMWSLMLSKDLFSRFIETGMMDPATSMEYRTKILVPGGSKDAADLVEDFLGRPYSFDAFAAWLSGENS